MYRTNIITFNSEDSDIRFQVVYNKEGRCMDLGGCRYVFVDDLNKVIRFLKKVKREIKEIQENES